MATILKSLNPEQLLTACGIMESTLILCINKLTDKGIDTSDLRTALDEAHAAVEWTAENEAVR